MVTVSVRRAIGGSTWNSSKTPLSRDFLKLDEQERNVRKRGREDGEWFDRTYGGVRK